MKTFVTRWGATATAITFVMSLPIGAQDDPARKAKPSANAEVKVSRNEAASEMVHRASEIAGMSVRNAAGKEIGTVKDMVIDVKKGEVRYAALSYGGFLGLGNKLFAVPWDAFVHRHNVGDNEHFFMLDADEATLKNAPGFDEEAWPNFADQKFSAGIDKYYDKYRPARGNVQINTKDAKVDVKVSASDRSTSDLSGDNLQRASKIKGMTVRNAAGAELGTVNDLVVAVKSGKVRYAALSYGGFLGVGDKLFAVPWNAFKCQYNPSENEYHLVLDLGEATLRKASGFDKDHWPNFADPKISGEIDKYYGSSTTTK